MSTFNVMSPAGRSQVLVDEQQLKSLQAEAARRGVELERLKSAMETLSAFNMPAHFLSAAMALCNELASRWNCERVSVGFLKARYVRVQALSHTEKITRNMQIVQDLEAAMEECLDQDVEIVVPPAKDASYVYRATDTLASRHGPSAVISFPLRRERTHLKERNDERFGNVVAVLTMERKFDKPFTLPEIETLRLTADLFTARLYELYENDRWMGAKALRGTRRALAWAVGAKHTWAKVAAIAVCIFLAYAIFAQWMFHVKAPFTIEAIQAQTIAVPFDSKLSEVFVDPGDMVFTPKTAAPFDDLNSICPLGPVISVPRPASVLARLDTLTTLQLDLVKARADLDKAQADVKNYRRDQKWGEMTAAELSVKKSQAEMDIIQWEIEHATITTPIDGIIFQGDLRTKINAPLRAGDAMFEIGQTEIRAELDVPEDQIMEVHLGQKGEFAASAHPERPIRFTVERIVPVATPASGKNVFKVRGQIDPNQDTSWLRPGVSGLAMVDVRKEPAGLIWIRPAINWLRMKLWM